MFFGRVGGRWWLVDELEGYGREVVGVERPLFGCE